jgi:tetratricopeptide (TPR) repeat protein
MKLLILSLSIIIGLASGAVASIPDSLKHRIDSLKTFLNSPYIKDRYAAEFGIAWELYDVDNRAAVTYAKLAYGSSCLIGDTAKMITSGRIFGQLLRRVDQLDSALSILTKVLPWAERDGNLIEQAKILNALAVIYDYTGVYDLALLYDLKVLRLRRAMLDSVKIGDALGNVGSVYLNMEHFEEASKYYLEALKYPGDSVQKAWLLTSLATAKLFSGDTQSFKLLSRNAILNSSPRGMVETMASYYYNYGMYYRMKGLFDSALFSYSKGLEHARRFADTRREIDNLLGIAQTYFENRKFDLAVGILDQVASIPHFNRYQGSALWYFDLKSSVLEKTGKFKEGLHFRNEEKKLREVMYSAEIRNNLAVARLEFEEEQNEAMILKQSELITMKELVIKRKNLLLIVSFVLAAALLLLAALLYKLSKYQKRISADLDRKVLERTRDLQASEKELMRQMGEQKLLLDIISGKIRASVATMRGLWDVAVSGSFEKSVLCSRFEIVTNDLLQSSHVIDRATEHRTHDAVFKDQIYAAKC